MVVRQNCEEWLCMIAEGDSWRLKYRSIQVAFPGGGLSVRSTQSSCRPTMSVGDQHRTTLRLTTAILIMFLLTENHVSPSCLPKNAADTPSFCSAPFLTAPKSRFLGNCCRSLFVLAIKAAATSLAVGDSPEDPLGAGLDDVLDDADRGPPCRCSDGLILFSVPSCSASSILGRDRKAYSFDTGLAVSQTAGLVAYKP